MAAILMTCVAAGVPARAADAMSQNSARAADRAGERPMLPTMAEAAAHIREHALFATNDLPKALTPGALKAYLAHKDPYSDYLTPEEYARFKASARGYAGVGMEIERRPNGEVLCFPYPDGPAARAGIRAGDRLLAIDGVSARGKALPTLAAVAIGEVNTPLWVEVASDNDRSRRVQIRRARIAAPRATLRNHGDVQVIEVPSFTPATKAEIAYILSGWKAASPVVIDLRGNFGGDFHAAIDSAMLFVPEGDLIGSVRTKSGVKQYASTLSGVRASGRVIVWQDAVTASAAEVFIAALTQNARAVSIGRKTFGKGTRQDVIELSDGSALILTTGYLLTPKGTRFDGVGLFPGEYLGRGAGTAAYLAGTARASRNVSTPRPKERAASRSPVLMSAPSASAYFDPVHTRAYP
jgi:carboxyl-terminal processing protease